MSGSEPHSQKSETSILKNLKIDTNVPRIDQGYNLDQADSHEDHDRFIEKCLVILSYFIVVVTFPLSLFIIFVGEVALLFLIGSVPHSGTQILQLRNIETLCEEERVVRQFERAVILRNGKLRSYEPYGPGLIQYLPCVDTIKYTDLRIICYAVPPQEALTKDALTVAVDAVVYYKIYDPIWAVVNVANYKIATQFLAATTLRNCLGTRKLSDILSDRPAVSLQVFGNMKNLTLNWGIKIVAFELKDISLPLQLQRAMATEAESYRLANAKIIVAKAEIESTRNLQEATKLLMDNPYCMQLRYLQALQMITGDKTHTIVMPLTADSIKKLFK